MKRLIWLSVLFRLAAIVLLLGAAVAMASWLTATRAEPARSQVTRTVTQVRVTPALRMTVQRQWRGYGVAGPMDAADVPAQVKAAVRDRPQAVVTGATVKRGDLLAQLDDDEFERQREMAQQQIVELDAELAQMEVERQFLQRRLTLEQDDQRLAERELERVKNLVSRGAGTPQDEDRAEGSLIRSQATVLATQEALARWEPRKHRVAAQLASAQAALRRAELDVSRCRVVSPLDGVLEAVDVDNGEQVMAGARVARVVGLRRMEVPLRLPGIARASIGVGDTVELWAQDRQAVRWRAAVSRIAPGNDQDTRTVTAYIEVVQNPAEGPADRLLAPGQFVEGMVRSSRGEQRWVVPRRAVIDHRLLLVDGGRIQSMDAPVAYALEQSVPESGLDDRHWVALEVDVPAQMGVVVNPSRNLLDGMEVDAAPATEPGAGAGSDASGDGGEGGS